MVMRDRSTVCHNLLSSGVFNLTVNLHRVRDTLILKAEVNIDSSSCVIDLSNSEGYERILLDLVSLALSYDLVLDLTSTLCLHSHRV